MIVQMIPTELALHVLLERRIIFLRSRQVAGFKIARELLKSLRNRVRS